jgi:hypothetical protein
VWYTVYAPYYRNITNLMWLRRFTHSDWLERKCKPLCWLVENGPITKQQGWQAKKVVNSVLFSDWSRTKSCAWTRASLPVRKPSHFGAKPPFCIRRPREKTYFCTIKAMLHGVIFLATCNAILLLRDVKLPSTSLHSADVFSTYRKFFTDFTN